MELKNEITCPTGKVCFKTKREIKYYIDIRNRRKGGDRFRYYYCPICGCYHLTSRIITGDRMLQKHASKYNRLQKKAVDLRIYQLNGLA